MGLTEDQVTEKLEELYAEAKRDAHRSCPDCGVKPGQAHLDGCDVARCKECGGQAISCGHTSKNVDIWDGLWPGTKECYERRLITYSDPNVLGGTGWMFDYNTLAVIRASS